MAAVAAMEWNGVPIDVPKFNALRNRWEAVKGHLVERIDADFGVYVPTGWNYNSASTSGNDSPNVGDDTEIFTLESEDSGATFPVSRLGFSTPRFAAWLTRAGIPWPRRWDSGDLALDDDTFRQNGGYTPRLRRCGSCVIRLGE